MKASQDKTINDVLRNSLSPSLFTLEFSNLPRNLDKETLIVDLWKHMEKTMNQSKKSKDPFNVVDIQLEEKNLVIGLEDQKGQLIKKVTSKNFKINKFDEKRNKLMRRWAKKYDSKKELPQFFHLINLKNFLESSTHITSINF